MNFSGNLQTHSREELNNKGVTIVEMLLAAVLLASVIVLVFSVVTYAKVSINDSSDSSNAATQSISQIELLKQYKSNSSASDWNSLRAGASSSGICFDPLNPADVLTANDAACFGSLRNTPSRVVIRLTSPNLFTATTYWIGASGTGLKVDFDVDGDGSDDRASLAQYRLAMP